MKILKYSEALARSSNPDWFKNTYKKSEICSDDLVDEINKLAFEVGNKALEVYFGFNDDLMLQTEYYDDLYDFLLDVKDGIEVI